MSDRTVSNAAAGDVSSLRTGIEASLEAGHFPDAQPSMRSPMGDGIGDGDGFHATPHGAVNPHGAADPHGMRDGAMPGGALSPLQFLDGARTAVLEWQTQMGSRLVETQTLLSSTEARLSAAQDLVREKEGVLETLRGELAALTLQRDDLVAQRDRITAEYNRVRGERDFVTGERDQITAERDRVSAERDWVSAERDQVIVERERISAERDQVSAERDQVVAARAQLAEEREQLAQERDKLARARDEMEQDRDHWRGDCQRHLEACRSLQDELAEAAHRNTNLNAELMELYRDLRAEDLPSLILRIGMKLTDAENGLYVDGSGGTTIAAIGMDNLSDIITEELHSLTMEAAHAEEPVVRNDSDSLPGGSDLVNMAALPVTVQGGVKGVLLVANKRSGPFSDDDTDLLLAIGNHAGIALENHRLHCQLAESYLSTIAVLADAIEAKDPYTRGHCESVAGIAVSVAQKLGWQDDALEHIRYAALLHDIGKIGIPDGILLKPGRLLPEEYQVIQRHTAIGSDLVSRVPSLEPIAATILHHHERVDGSGYPSGLSGEDISLASRIIGVVDAFDAMTTPRPYREPVSPQEALEELRRCTGTQFDEGIVNLVAIVLSERAKPNETVQPVADTAL